MRIMPSGVSSPGEYQCRPISEKSIVQTSVIDNVARISVYGLTEVTGISHSDDERNIKMGSAGLPLPNMMAKVSFNFQADIRFQI